MFRQWLEYKYNGSLTLLCVASRRSCTPAIGNIHFIMEFTTTKRGARALIYRRHRYVINRRGQDGRIFWRCGRSRSCSGSITTMDDNILSQRDVRNHEPDEDKIAIEKIVSNMKIKAMETTRAIPAIYHDAIQEIASMNNKDDLASKMPTFD